MKFKQNIQITKKPLLLLIVSLTLSFCMIPATQPPPATPTSPASTSAADSVAPTASVVEIPVTANGLSDEQQALIDEINRDGEALRFDGFTEDVPVLEELGGDDIVELNYEQADLRLVLEELANALDISIVIDSSIDSKVSLRTSSASPLRLADIWPLIRLLSRDAGIVIDRVGNIYNARKIASTFPLEIATPDTLGQGSATRILQITPLTYISSQAAIQVVEPLLAPDGKIRTLIGNNTLAISASESQLQRINELLFLIDADPFQNQGIHLYQLLNASAVEVADELAEILQLVEGATPAYQVKGIERINAVLVTAPATRGFEEISRWIRILDADGQEQVEQLFHYQVKNLSAAELAGTLSEVFAGNEDVNPARTLNRNNDDDFANSTDSAGQGTDAADAARFREGSNANSTAAVSANLTVKIVADEATNSLLIRSTVRDYRQLLTTINQLDVVPLQVMINAVIAQITLNDLNRFGVDWSRMAINSQVNATTTAAETNFVPAAGLGGLVFSKTFIDGAAQVEATLEAIAVNNEVKLLARPSLTVTNNQEGEIQIGSQVPVEEGSSVGTGGVATTNIQYRDTGIVLSITPQINSDGIVNLVINQALRSVEASSTGVNNNPIFNNQEITTNVIVQDGENVVLGGLIQTEIEDLSTGVPGLKRLPLLGKLFSYQQANVERRELFIIIRPEIIDLNAEIRLGYEDILDRFELASALIESAGI